MALDDKPTIFDGQIGLVRPPQPEDLGWSGRRRDRGMRGPRVLLAVTSTQGKAPDQRARMRFFAPTGLATAIHALGRVMVADAPRVVAGSRRPVAIADLVLKEFQLACALGTEGRRKLLSVV